MSKKCGLIVAVLSAAVLVMVYKFVLTGSVAPSHDERVAVVLTEGERDLVLHEMRKFLESVQQITQGVVANDMKAVSADASRVGLAAQHGMPGSMIGKLPLEFKKFAALTENCVACHAMFKFQTENEVH